MVDINIILHRYQNEQAYQKAYDSVLQALFECVRDKERGLDVGKIHLGELALQIESFQEKLGPFVYMEGLVTLENTKFATTLGQSNNQAFPAAKQLATTVLSQANNIDDNFWKEVNTAVITQTQKKLSPTAARKASTYKAADVTDQYSKDIDQAQLLKNRFQNCENRDVAVTRLALKPFPLHVVKGADSIEEAQKLYNQCYEVYKGLWKQVEKFKLAKDPSSLIYLEALGKVLAETPTEIHKDDVVGGEVGGLQSWYTKAQPLLNRGLYYRCDLVSRDSVIPTLEQKKKDSLGYILEKPRGPREITGVQSFLQDVERTTGGLINFTKETVSREGNTSPLNAYSQEVKGAPNSIIAENLSKLLNNEAPVIRRKDTATFIKSSFTRTYSQYVTFESFKCLFPSIDDKRWIELPGCLYFELEYSNLEQSGPTLTHLETDSYLIYLMIYGVRVNILDASLLERMGNENAIRTKHQETTQKLSAYLSTSNKENFNKVAAAVRDFESNYGRYLLLPSFAGDKKQAQYVLNSIQNIEDSLKKPLQSPFEKNTFSFAIADLFNLKMNDLKTSVFLLNHYTADKSQSRYNNLKWAYVSGSDVTDAWRDYIFNKTIPESQQAKNLEYIVGLLHDNKHPMPKGLLFKDNAELHQLLVLIGDDSKLMSRFIKLFIKQDKYNTAPGPDLIGFLTTVLGESKITERPAIKEGATEEEKARDYILRNYFSDPQFRSDINDYLLESKAIDRLKDGEIVNLAKLDKSTSTAYVLLTGPYLRSGLSSLMASRYSSATINVGRISFSLPKLTTLHRLKKVSPDTFYQLFEAYQVNFKKNYGEKATYAAGVIAEAQRVYSSPGLKHLNHDQLIATAQGDTSGELAKILLTGNHRGVGNKITGADIPVLLQAYFASCAKEVDPVKREKATNIKYQAIRDYFVEPKGLFVDFDNKQLVAAAQGDTSGEIARILLTSSRRSVIGKKITGAEIPALLEAYFANCIKAKDPANPTPAEIAQQQTDEQAEFKDIKKNFTKPTGWFFEPLTAWLRGDNRVAELNNYLQENDIKLTTRQHNLLLNGVLKDTVTGIDRSLVQLRCPSSDAGSAVNRPIAGSDTATKEISASTRVGADSGRKLSRSSGSDSESPRGSHSVDNSPQTLKELFVTVYFKTIGNTDDKLKSKIDLLQRLAISQIKFTELHDYAHNQNRDWIAPKTTFNADMTLAEIISHAKESINADPDLIANIVETSNDNDDDTPKKLNAKTVHSLKHASNDMLAAVYLHESVGSNMQFVKDGILSNPELCVKLLSTENKAQAKALMTNDNNVTALVNMYEAVSDVNLQAELKQLLIQLNRTAAKENKFHEGFKSVFGFGGQFIYEDKNGKTLQPTPIDKNKTLEVAEQHTPPTIKT